MPTEKSRKKKGLTPVTIPDSKKKSSTRQKTSSKKKSKSHLKPRKPIQKKEGVLAFPEDKDYREMQLPAKTKFVSADSYLGDQYDSVLKQKG